MKKNIEKVDHDKLAAKFELRGIAKRQPGRPSGKRKPISEMTLEERPERGCG